MLSSLYLAVDWALACDTVPDHAKAPKDMGVSNVAQTLPSSNIRAIEGGLIDQFKKHVASTPATGLHSAA